MTFPDDDTRERYLATANDATAFAIDEEIAEAFEAGDEARAQKLMKEREALFLGHFEDRGE